MIRVESPKRAGIALALIFLAVVDGGIGLVLGDELAKLPPGAPRGWLLIALFGVLLVAGSAVAGAIETARGGR
jgi:hypothetical protein